MNAAWFRIVLLLALLFNGALLIPVGAHLLEMHAKLALPRDAYLTTQSLYNGWAWFGLAYLGSIVTLVALIVRLWRKYEGWLLVIALLSVMAALSVFFGYVYPVNQATSNWTMLPENWEALRSQWEWGHAISAPLIFLAFLLVCWSAASRASPEGPNGR